MSLDHILLGFLQEPQTGYELKAMFDVSINYFWPAELSQIYRTLKRLEADGLLRSRRKPSEKGPQRRVYSLTALGRKELAKWLESEPKFGDERFTYLAQIFFMAQRGNLDRTLRFVEQMRDRFRSRLARYRKIERDWTAGLAPYPSNESDEGFHQHLTLRMGLHRVAATVKWCDETIGRIKERNATKSPARDGKHGSKR